MGGCRKNWIPFLGGRDEVDPKTGLEVEMDDPKNGVGVEMNIGHFFWGVLLCLTKFERTGKMGGALCKKIPCFYFLFMIFLLSNL